MDILIESETSDNQGRSFSVVAAGQRVYVRVPAHKSAQVNVIVQNASHRAWRGCGKFFDSLESALDAYKSEKVKAAIRYAIGQMVA
jgi:DNA-binding protein H-NS